MPFMRLIYESVFPGKKLADKPKPWRIQFLLELTYGGWTLVRTVVKSVFSRVKDLQYGILVNLLDNYIPLTLCSYSILFKLNRLDDYYFSIFRLWIMFFCFHRKNYNKAPLFWLSNLLFWQTNGCRDIYNFLQVLSVLSMSILLSLSTALQGNQQILQTVLITFNRNCFPFLHQGKGRQTSVLPLPLPRTIFLAAVNLCICFLRLQVALLLF